MFLPLHQQIIELARPYYSVDDPSHDFEHIKRVLNNALKIQAKEGGDLDIIIAAVSFHDSKNYPKDDPRSAFATQESADLAESKLISLVGYPQEKIAHVKTCIMEHSFSAGLKASTLESKIVQDADRLEATGVISIMRTFASTGQMKRPFYDYNDPFCHNREPDAKSNAVDLFFVRLLKVRDMMNTNTAKEMASVRTQRLELVLEWLADEIDTPRYLTPLM